MSTLSFRRRGSNLTLPTSDFEDYASSRSGDGFAIGNESEEPARSSNLAYFAHSFRRSRNMDGSARGIRLHGDKSIRQVWNDAQTATKATYILMGLFVVAVYVGIRSLRYHHTQINLNCGIRDCILTITPVGWKRKSSISIPRRQLHSALAVKTTLNGTYVSANPSLNENVNLSNRQNKKYPARTHKTPSVTYKGPDAYGHYVSYAVVLADFDNDAESEVREGDEISKLSELTTMQEYLQNASVMGEEYERTLLLTFHLFGISHSKRRVRTMMTRVDSYVKRRRHTLNVKESGNPSWVGILCVVFGVLGIFLILLLGQFVDTKPPAAQRGPGARRRTDARTNRKPDRSYDDSKASRSTSFTSPYLRATPARFEVRMQPASVNSQKLY